MTEKKKRSFTGMFFKGCFCAKTMLVSSKKKRQKTLKKKRKVFRIQQRAEKAGRKNYMSLVVFGRENESSSVEGVCLGLFFQLHKGVRSRMLKERVVFKIRHC